MQKKQMMQINNLHHLFMVNISSIINQIDNLFLIIVQSFFQYKSYIILEKKLYLQKLLSYNFKFINNQSTIDSTVKISAVLA